MEATSPQQITQLLVDWGRGDGAALERLMPLVYNELRRLARRYMRNERPGHTLQTTALVNEAYLKLAGQRGARFENRTHFYAIAASLMRRIMIDHARRRAYGKRGGGVRPVSLSEEAAVVEQRGAELVALDEALEAFALVDPRRARVVELRFFGGLSVEETATVLAVNPRTVKRDWRLARAWLRRQLAGDVVGDELLPQTDDEP